MVDNKDQTDFLISLNSEDASRDTNTTYSSLKWNIADPYLSFKRQGYWELTLDHIQFVNNVYPINRFNNIISFVVNNVQHTITIPPNNYNGTNLSTLLTSYFNTTSTGTWLITFDTQSQLITFTNTNLFLFVYIANNIYKNLGIYTDGIYYTTYISPNPINLIGTLTLDVLSNIQTGSYLSTNTTNFITTIENLGGFGQAVFYHNYLSKSIVIRQYDFSLFEIYLRDQDGNPYELPSNIIFKITFYVKPLVGELS